MFNHFQEQISCLFTIVRRRNTTVSYTHLDVYKRQGLGVPFEMTLGVHSDAGFSKEDDLIGTLGIYTTDYNSGKLNAGKMCIRDRATV